MKHPRFLLALACAASFTCVSSEYDGADEPAADTEPSESQPIARWDGGGDAPGEVIHIEGEAPPGSQGGAPWSQGHSGANPTGGGGGGGGGGKPDKYEPEPKDCMKEADNDACHQCCEYNVDKVYYPRCKKMRDKDKRRLCRQKAEEDTRKCHKDCGSVIIYYPTLGAS